MNIGLFLILTLPAYAKQEEILKIEVSDEILKIQLSINEIDAIFSSFDTLEYARDKSQREQLARHLIHESNRLKHDWGIARGKNILGVLLRDRAEYDEAIELHELALELAGNDTIVIIYALNNLGVVYRRLNQPRIAIDYHMKALEHAEEFKGCPNVTNRSIGISLNSIGNINLILNQPEQALKVFNETLLMEQKLNNKRGIAINYHNIGYAHEAMGQLNLANSFYHKSLEQNIEIESNVGKAICYNSIGEILLKQELPNEALSNFEQSMQFALLTNDNYYIAQAHANLGKAYLELKDYVNALPELLNYQNIAEQIGSLHLLKDAYRTLSTYYEESGEYENALFLFKKASEYSDSVLNEKNSRYLNEVQFLYEAEKKEQTIELLTIENRAKTQQLVLMLLGAMLIILLGTVFYVLYKRKTDKQRIELETRLFRSLMNPHFIFNALASIQSFLYKNEAQKAAGYLGNFSKLTRSILKNSINDLVPLEEELETLRNYLEIEEMRLRDCFSFNITIDENIELDFVYVMPTMMQPFVENAIYHGLKNTDCTNGLITINIKEYGKYVRIEIKDNGCGINKSIRNKKDDPHKSMGLKIFEERIKLIERKYKKSVKFAIIDLSDIDKNNNGTMVSIDFPHIDPND